MDKNSQDKVIRAGFRIIRKDDYPQPRIKIKINNQGSDWRTLAKFVTKAERDRAFAGLLEDELTISD